MFPVPGCFRANVPCSREPLSEPHLFLSVWHPGTFHSSIRVPGVQRKFIWRPEKTDWCLGVHSTPYKRPHKVYLCPCCERVYPSCFDVFCVMLFWVWESGLLNGPRES